MAEKDKLAELHDFLKYDVEVSFLDGDVIDVAMDVISKHIEMIKKLEKQNKHYRESLEFYATRDNYKLEHFDPNLNDYMSTVDYDEGEIARKALEESE